MKKIYDIDCSVSLTSVLCGFPPEWETQPQKNTVPIGLPAGEYFVDYNYPLTTSERVSYQLTPQTTPDDILKLVAKEYQRIYDEEALTGNLKRTDGKYGIWGCSFGELFVDGLKINTETMSIELMMGS